MPVLSEWRLSLDVDAVLRGQGADPAVLRTRKPQLVILAEQALETARPLVTPQVAFQLWDVEALQHEKVLLSEGRFLSGTFVVQQLACARQVAAIVCTIGESLETLASQTMQTDLPFGLALDGVGSAAAEALGIAARDYFRKLVAEDGWQTTLPLGPGMDGWPTNVGQPQLFSLLDASQVGVQLLESCLMAPRKTVSFVLGLGPGVQSLNRLAING